MHRYALLICIFCLSISGCSFLFPLYTKKDIVKVPHLIGNWIQPHDTLDGGGTWEISAYDNNGYQVLHRTGGLIQVHYVVFLNIRDKMFCDIQMCTSSWLDCSEKTNDHIFGKVEVRGDSLLFNQFYTDIFERRIKKGDVKVQYRIIPSDGRSDYPSPATIMITEPTEKLQQFIMKYYNDSTAWMGDMVFVRK